METRIENLIENALDYELEILKKIRLSLKDKDDINIINYLDREAECFNAVCKYGYSHKIEKYDTLNELIIDLFVDETGISENSECVRRLVFLLGLRSDFNIFELQSSPRTDDILPFTDWLIQFNKISLQDDMMICLRSWGNKKHNNYTEWCEIYRK